MESVSPNSEDSETLLALARFSSAAIQLQDVQRQLRTDLKLTTNAPNHIMAFKTPELGRQFSPEGPPPKVCVARLAHFGILHNCEEERDEP